MLICNVVRFLWGVEEGKWSCKQRTKEFCMACGAWWLNTGLKVCLWSSASVRHTKRCFVFYIMNFINLNTICQIIFIFYYVYNSYSYYVLFPFFQAIQLCISIWFWFQLKLYTVTSICHFLCHISNIIFADFSIQTCRSPSSLKWLSSRLAKRPPHTFYLPNPECTFVD